MFQIKKANRFYPIEFSFFRVKWSAPAETVLKGNNHVYSIPLPGAGNVLNFMLNIMNNYEMNYTPLSWHRMIESFKFGYAKRTSLGDMDFVPDLEPVSLTNGSNLTK